MIQSMLDSIINEVKKEKFQQELIDPIIHRIIDKLKPYVFSVCLLFTVLILCVFFLVFKSIRNFDM